MSNSTTSVLLFPLVLAAMFLAMQWAMTTWATAIAQGAANQGAYTAAAYGSSATAGHTAATTALNTNILQRPTIHATRGTTTAAVTITGEAVKVFPGLPTHVTVTVTAPLERLTHP